MQAIRPHGEGMQEQNTNPSKNVQAQAIEGDHIQEEQEFANTCSV